MADAVRVPVSVKSRIGIAGRESYEDLARFVDTVSAAGCRIFVVHARTAVLGGLSPRENREVPPLRHDLVHLLKRDFPQLEIIVNGGIRSLSEARNHLAHVDGVMLGRAVCDNPSLLGDADREIFGQDSANLSRREVFARFTDYAAARLARGEALHNVSRHALGVFRGVPGARSFRRHLSRHAGAPGAGIEVLQEALELVANA
jgi:tRNA-dihydrouridine synthase A